MIGVASLPTSGAIRVENFFWGSSQRKLQNLRYQAFRAERKEALEDDQERDRAGKVHLINTRRAFASDGHSRVYTVTKPTQRLNLMSAFRKDLFVSVTLPLLALGVPIVLSIGGAFLWTWMSYSRLDDAIGPLESATAALTENSKQTRLLLDEIKLMQKQARDDREIDRQQSRVDYERLNDSLQELKQGQAVAAEALKRSRLL